MQINVLRKSTAYDQEFERGIQDVTDYYAQALVNAGMAVEIVEQEVKKEIKKDIKSKK